MMKGILTSFRKCVFEKNLLKIMSLALMHANVLLRKSVNVSYERMYHMKVSISSDDYVFSCIFAQENDVNIFYELI